MQPRLVIFMRYPVAGQAKTRLIPALGGEGAAAIHKTLSERTLATVSGSGRQAEVRITGAPESDFVAWLGDGPHYREQVSGDLTERLLDALDPAPVIFFGADTPDLAEHHVAAAIDALESCEVVIGPAEDGGYYLIGVAGAYRYLFDNMRWSTEHVLPDTLKRLAARGITPVLLETLNDCDRPEDLALWPWLTA